jgi:hypothetical protein
MADNEFHIIYTYSRRQAIEDGVLIDVTDQAKSNGFKIPVAVTDHLFNGYVLPPEGLEGEGQSLEGRLHDLLEMTKAAAASDWGGSRVEFECIFLMKPKTFQKVKCVAMVGPGDQAEPVMTIMLPGDD